MSAATLSGQRCLHHPAREAVARCTVCGSSYCRECIAEHDDRLICATCLQRLMRKTEVRRRPWGKAVLRAGGMVTGVFLAWLSFYAFGRMLLMLPSSFHSEIWGQDKVELTREER
jgi:hypothetical protein